MLMTRASEYALLALVILSRSDRPRDTDSLAKELGISKSFLAKILQGLAKQGVLRSYKGANGGFILAKEPKEISVLKILHAAEGKSPAVFDCSEKEENCPSEKASICNIWPFLNTLQHRIDIFLASITLEEILHDPKLNKNIQK